MTTTHTTGRLSVSFIHAGSSDGFLTIDGPSIEELSVRLQASPCDDGAWLRVVDATKRTVGWVRRDGSWRTSGAA